MRFLEETDSDDPILSVVNLIDIFLAVVAMLMIIIVKNPLNPFSNKNVVVVENPGEVDMRIMVKDGSELKQYETSEETGEGRGHRAGVIYRIPDGRLIYVPERQPKTRSTN
jgi:hypothetical protein